MAKKPAKKDDEKTEVEKTADALSQETQGEIDQMEGQNTPETSDTTEVEAGEGDQGSGVEHEFCQMFNLQQCSPAHVAALKKAERLLDASPAVTLAAVMLNMTLPR